MEGNAQRTTARKATLKHNIHNRQEDDMKTKEALAMMDKAPQSEKTPSRVNDRLTQAQAVGLIREWIKEYPEEYTLSGLMEKRVLQVCQDRKRPNRRTK